MTIRWCAGDSATFLKVFDDLLELVGEADSGAAAIELCGQVSPDVILMDLMMPDMDGATTTWPHPPAVSQGAGRCPDQLQRTGGGSRALAGWGDRLFAERCFGR